MANDLYQLMRGMIGDATHPYTIPDTRLLTYLDRGLDALSSMVDYQVNEDVVISASDITAGYKDLTHEVVEIIDFELEGGGVYWEMDGGKRIRFIQSEYVPAGTYEIQYRARYKKFDGSIRDNNYFDYPRSADLGIVFYALGMYSVENGIVKADGSINFTQSKSEEGMSVNYGGSVGYSTKEDLKTPSALIERGLEIMRSLSNSKIEWTSVMV